jgi:hypothetical protein
MGDFWDNPAFDDDGDFQDNSVSFEQVGDRCRGTLLKMETVNTRYGERGKLTIDDVDRRRPMVVMLGSKNLVGQMKNARPAIGDLVSVTLQEIRNVAQGTAKIWQVDVRHTAAGGYEHPGTNQPRPEQPTPMRPQSPPADDYDLFAS